MYLPDSSVQELDKLAPVLSQSVPTRNLVPSQSSVCRPVQYFVCGN